MTGVTAKYIRLSAEDVDLGKDGKIESNSVTNQRNLLDAVISRCGLEGGEITVFPKVNDEYSIMYLWHPKTGQAGSA